MPFSPMELRRPLNFDLARDAPLRRMVFAEWDEVETIVADLYNDRLLENNIVLIGPVYKDSHCQYPKNPPAFIFSRRTRLLDALKPQQLSLLIKSLRPERIVTDTTHIDGLSVTWHPSAIVWLENLKNGTTKLVTLFLATNSLHLERKLVHRPRIMARRYTKEDLLFLRDKLPFVICDMKQINPTISSDIIRVPEEARLGQKSVMYLSKKAMHSLPSMTQDQSDSQVLCNADEDEERIVYRGHPSRRPVREMTWHLRRRDSSDRSTQPHPAPAGIEAQKAANFKRFYRAVVSPTHVRVTAGGRIVPNHRAPPQPMFSCDTEQQAPDLTNQPVRHRSSDDIDQQTPWLQGVSLGAMDLDTNFSDNHIAGHNSAVCSLGNQLASVSVDQVPTTCPEPLSAGKDEHPIACSTSSWQEVPRVFPREDIEISPPSQFDTSRPFLYNGQWVHPMPTGFQPPVQPFNVLGNPNLSHAGFVPPVPPGMIFPQQLQFPGSNPASTLPILPTAQQGSMMNFPSFAPMMLPVTVPSGVLTHGPIPGGTQTGSHTTFQAPAHVDHQLQILKHQLKHLDNQLENNKHQIDENYVLKQRDLVEFQISALQSSFGGQNHRPRPSFQRSKTSIDGSSADAMSSLGLKPAHRLHLKTEVGEKNEVASGSHQSICDQPAVEISNPVSKIKSRSMGTSTGSGSPLCSEPSTRKRLSAAAAMAPPFLPRNMQPYTALVTPSDVITENFNLRTPQLVGLKDPKKQAVTTNTSSDIVSDWMIPSEYHFMHQQPLSMPKAQTIQNTIRSDHLGVSSSTLSPLSSFNAASVAGTAEVTRNESFADSTPYLMGFAPPGIPYNRASSSDLLYPRKLTDEEQRARHLYWGNAPYEVSKGLPKFDGRDFYPASPVKKAASPTARTFESEFFSGRETDMQTAVHNLHSDTKLQQHKVRPGESVVKDDSEVQDHTNPGTSKYAVKRKMTWEKLLDADKEDIASVDSWGVTRSVENELFAPQASGNARIGDNTSSSRRYMPAEDQSAIHRTFNIANSQPSFLQGMLRNSPRSAMAAALTGSPSPTTVQGFLPQFRGSVAATLAPSISNVNASLQGFHTIGFETNIGRASRADSMTSVRNENLPPLPSSTSHSDIASAADLLRRLNRPDKEHHDPGFDQNTTGVGPVEGPDW